MTNLIIWRWTPLPGPAPTPAAVADSLTVEAIPARFRGTVTAFRHLCRDARVAACRRAIEGM